jgi:hypothetical protein
MTLKMVFFDNWNLNVIYNSLNDVCKLLIIAHKQVVRGIINNFFGLIYVSIL